MTREEAIKIFNTVLCLGKCDCPKDEIEECLRMAIKALEQQPSEEEKVIRIKKGTLKVRTGRYVIYDVEWLKEHFNTTEAKIYGQPSERTEERTETHECESKADKALNLLAEWVIECGFGYDNIPEEYEKYKDDIAEMGYREGLIYIVKRESEVQE